MAVIDQRYPTIEGDLGQDYVAAYPAGPLSLGTEGSSLFNAILGDK
jgi:hypothetical protein